MVKMKVIEFFGMPRAGKTEQINKLSLYLKEKGISHLIITDREVEKEIDVPLESAFEYNMLFFSKIFEKLLFAKQNKKHKIVILDRGFLDAEAWFSVEHEQKRLSDHEKRTAEKYLEPLRNNIDVGILLLVDPKVTRARHESKGETGKADDYVLGSYLEELYREYLRLKDKFRNDSRVLILDGNETSEELHSKIKDKLQKEGVL